MHVCSDVCLAASFCLLTHTHRPFAHRGAHIAVCQIRDPNAARRLSLIAFAPKLTGAVVITVRVLFARVRLVTRKQWPAMSGTRFKFNQFTRKVIVRSHIACDVTQDSSGHFCAARGFFLQREGLRRWQSFSSAHGDFFVWFVCWLTVDTRNTMHLQKKKTFWSHVRGSCAQYWIRDFVQIRCEEIVKS